MLGTIVRKEFLERLISFRFFLATALCVLLLPGVVYVRAREYVVRAAAYPKTVQSYHKRISEMPREFVWTSWQHPLARPLNPVSILVEPVDLRDGGETELYWLAKPNYLRSDQSNPMAGLYPAFNVLTFVTVVISLLAIVFSFDAVCGEKEQGTLKLMLANAVPRSTLLAGKWLGGLGSLLLPFLLGAVVSALVLLTSTSGHLAPAHWVELGLIFLISVLFISVTYTAGICVSALTANAATSAAWLLLSWAVAFLVYPNLAPVAAGWIAPMPARTARHEEALKHWGPVYDRLDELWSEFEEKWQPLKDDPAAKNDYWIQNRRIYQQEQHMVNRALGAVHEASARKLERQVEVASAILRATPLGSYVLAVDELAGTGATERSRLLTAVTRYHREFFIYFANRSVEMVQRRKDEGLSDMPPYTVGDFPLFEYQESTAAHRVSHSLLDVVLLVAWNAVLFLVAYACFLRYDVS